MNSKKNAIVSSNNRFPQVDGSFGLFLPADLLAKTAFYSTSCNTATHYRIFRFLQFLERLMPPEDAKALPLGFIRRFARKLRAEQVARQSSPARLLLAAIEHKATTRRNIAPHRPEHKRRASTASGIGQRRDANDRLDIPRGCQRHFHPRETAVPNFPSDKVKQTILQRGG